MESFVLGWGVGPITTTVVPKGPQLLQARFLPPPAALSECRGPRETEQVCRVRRRQPYTRKPLTKRYRAAFARTVNMGPSIQHKVLSTTFQGVVHPHVSGIHQYRGIQYAKVQKRFRKARLFTQYGKTVDATAHGYVSSQYQRDS